MKFKSITVELDKSYTIQLNMATLGKIEAATGKTLFEIVERIQAAPPEGTSEQDVLKHRARQMDVTWMLTLLAGAVGQPVAELQNTVPLPTILPAFRTVAQAIAESVGELFSSIKPEVPEGKAVAESAA